MSRRVLFLHGMWLPSECYTDKLAVGLLETMKRRGYDCDFVNSPRKCPDTPPELLTTMFPDLDSFPEWVNAESREDGTKLYHGLEDSLAFLQRYLKEHPRYDVIAGHSNGALMTSILALRMESDPDFLPKDKHCRAIVLFNAPASYDTEDTLKSIVVEHGPIQMPSIHVWGGPTDLTWQGEQMMRRVHHPKGIVVQHEAGHWFPSDTKYYDEILNALDKALA